MKKFIISVLGISLFVIILISGCGKEDIGKEKSTSSKNKIDNYSNLVLLKDEDTPLKDSYDNINNEKEAILIYAETIEEIQNGKFASYKVWQKINENSPEELFEMKNVRGLSLRLSPGKRFLFVSSVDKIQLFDLQEKKMIDLFNAKKGVIDFVLSPDGDQIFIWDQIYLSLEDRKHYVHVLNWETGEIKTISEGVDIRPGAYLGAWREDDKIIMTIPGGEVASLRYYDLKTNKIIDLDSYVGMSNSISSDGAFLIMANSSVKNPCNAFSGVAISGYKIVDLISKEYKGEIGDTRKSTFFRGFSPDNKKLIFVTKEVPEKEIDCNKDFSEEFFEMSLRDSITRKINYKEYLSILKDWNINSVGADLKYESKNNTYEIWIDDNLIISSSLRLQIATQFYR